MFWLYWFLQHKHERKLSWCLVKNNNNNKKGLCHHWHFPEILLKITSFQLKNVCMFFWKLLLLPLTQLNKIPGNCPNVTLNSFVTTESCPDILLKIANFRLLIVLIPCQNTAENCLCLIQNTCFLSGNGPNHLRKNRVLFPQTLNISFRVSIQPSRLAATLLTCLK